jgi:hypothetical protein
MGLSFLLMPVNRGNEAHVLFYQVLFAAPLAAPMHQTGASKTAYKRSADLGWYLPITGKRPPASLTRAPIARGRANVAARHNNDITFENKSSPSQSAKRR